LKSGFLKNKKHTFLAGLLFGIGILTKASFLFLLPGFVVLVLVAAVQRKAYRHILGRIDNLFYFVLPVVLTAGFWFLVNQAHYNYTLPTMKNFAEINHEYPANPEVSPSKLVLSWGKFDGMKIPMTKAGELQEKAIKLMDRAGYN
jgi:4-amino-4-deoxy-L-arabinose transferase-like glycosyltransferase